MSVFISRLLARPVASGPVRLDATALERRVAGLELATRMATGRVPESAVRAATAALAVAGARQELAGDHTVVALAGATGSGKSSIFNALVGASVARASARRPTTGEPMAAVWQPGPGVTSLLEWLGVSKWHVVEPAVGETAAGMPGIPGGGERADPGGLGGLVLVDLPDHDSTESAHRDHVDRLVARADVMIWVMDPQKYADAVVHDQYLARFARHGEVTLVVLNQADLLSPADVDACLAHLGELVAADGLRAVRVLAMSARTGAGVDQLQAILRDVLSARQAALVRTAADMAAAADVLEQESGDTGATLPVMPKETDQQLAAALASAAGVDVVAAAVADSVRRSGQAATGWPVLGWPARRRRDPLADLRLTGPAPDLLRTSMPAPDPVVTAGAGAAIREYATRASQGAPPGWVRSARAVAAQTVTELLPDLDRAVAGAQVGAPRPPRWWSVVRVLQWALLVLACAGALWLLGLAALGMLAMPRPQPPTVGALPVPTLLLVAGMLLGFVMAGLAGFANRRGAARAARIARIAVTAKVAELVRVQVTGPIAAELATLEDFRVGLIAARGE